MPQQRLFPNDRTARSVRTRKATISSADAGNPIRYYVTFEGAGYSEPATYMGTAALTVGTRVVVEAAPELHQWRILSSGSGAVATAVHNALLVGGRAGSNWSPAKGWFASGMFGANVQDAFEPPWAVSTDHIEAIAWHPSGEAVAVWYTDAGSHIDCWRFDSGVGFGDKYVSIPWSEIEAFQNSVYTDATKLPTSVGSDMAFSPDGQFLAIAGFNVDAVSNIEATHAVFRFSLANGFDWLHPLRLANGTATAVNGRAVAWKHDSSSFALGTDNNITGGYRGIEIPILVTDGIPSLDSETTSLDQNSDDTTAAITCMEYSHDDACLAIGFDSVIEALLLIGASTVPGGMTTPCVGVSWYLTDARLVVCNYDGCIDYALSGATHTTIDSTSSIPLDVVDDNSMFGAALNKTGSLLVQIGTNSGVVTAEMYSYSASGVGGHIGNAIASVSDISLVNPVKWQP